MKGASVPPDSVPSQTDRAMLREALRWARKGEGQTHPNPSVGAVVYRGRKLLGAGRTQAQSRGGAHAEVMALRSAARKHGERALRGASVAVTLEPCSFVGRTGACSKALLEARVGRVVAGVRDPHPRVAGRGLRELRRGGVEVVVGLLEEECARQHRGFFSVCQRGRPFVTLKLATTLDGRIALANGESRWITSDRARAYGHRLRAKTDAILVGSETALLDDPELSARRGDRVVRRPIRLLLDSGLRVPATRKLFRPPDDSRTWVLCRENARGIAAVRDRAERVLEIPRSDRRHIDLTKAFARLAEEGLTSVLVEGGGQLAAALLKARLVDEVHWMLAPKLIGGDGKPGLGALSLERLRDAVELEVLSTRLRGPDLHIHAKIDPARRKAKK